MKRYTDKQLNALDALAAEHVMGWTWRKATIRFPKCLPGEVPYTGWYEADDLMARSGQYHPTRDNAQAAYLRAKMAEDGWSYEMFGNPDGKIWIAFLVAGSPELIGTFEASTEAIATVIAALRAKGLQDQLHEVEV